MRYFLFFVGILYTASVYGGYTVNPVSLRFLPDTQVISLDFSYDTDISLKNSLHKDTKQFHVILYAWNQYTENNQTEDTLTPSQDLILSPHSFSISQGETQKIRLALKKKVSRDRSQEILYRLYIKEVPIKDKNQQGISFAYQFVLPVSIEPNEKKIMSPICKAKLLGSYVLLDCLNNSNIYHKITEIKWTDSTREEQSQKILQYLFPLKTTSVKHLLKGSIDVKKPLQLTIYVDEKKLNIAVPINN